MYCSTKAAFPPPGRSPRKTDLGGGSAGAHQRVGIALRRSGRGEDGRQVVLPSGVQCRAVRALVGRASWSACGTPRQAPFDRSVCASPRRIEALTRGRCARSTFRGYICFVVCSYADAWLHDGDRGTVQAAIWEEIQLVAKVAQTAALMEVVVWHSATIACARETERVRAITSAKLTITRPIAHAALRSRRSTPSSASCALPSWLSCHKWLRGSSSCGGSAFTPRTSPQGRDSSSSGALLPQRWPPDRHSYPSLHTTRTPLWRTSPT